MGRRARAKFSVRAKEYKTWAVMNRLLKEAQAGRKLYAKVGIQSPEAESPHGTLTNAELAAIHEFGAPAAGIPARPFIRPVLDENRVKYARMLVPLLRKVLAGEGTLEGALLIVGEAIRGDMLARVMKGLKPKLKPATVKAKKGEPTPLIDTFQMLGAIRATVAEK